MFYNGCNYILSSDVVLTLQVLVSFMVDTANVNCHKLI